MTEEERYQQRKTAIHMIRSGVRVAEVAQRLGRSAIGSTSGEIDSKPKVGLDCIANLVRRSTVQGGFPKM